MGARFLECSITGCVLDDVALDGARLADCLLIDVRAHTLSATASTWRDVARATLDRLDLRGAELSALHGLGHLRGAVISRGQLLELGPALAAHLGIDVVG